MTDLEHSELLKTFILIRYLSFYLVLFIKNTFKFKFEIFALKTVFCSTNFSPRFISIYKKKMEKTTTSKRSKRRKKLHSDLVKKVIQNGLEDISRNKKKLLYGSSKKKEKKIFFVYEMMN